MITWEYASVPLLIHTMKQILDTWGKDGWELVSVVTPPDGGNPLAFFKRPTGSK